HRDTLIIDEHIIGIGDALLRHDVVIAALEVADLAVAEPSLDALGAAFAEIEFADERGPVVGPDEPGFLALLGGEGHESQGRIGGDVACDGEGVEMGRIGHGDSSYFLNSGPTNSASMTKVTASETPMCEPAGAIPMPMP